MKWYIPREHGSWSMWITPFIIGATVAGWEILHIPALFGMLFLYMAVSALLVYIRRPKKKPSPIPSMTVYGLLGLGIFLFPLIAYPQFVLYGVLVGLLFCFNIYFAKQKKERLITNDVLAICGMAVTGSVAYHIGAGAFSVEAIYIWAISVVFFVGSVFHVKSFIREKKNASFKRKANIVYLLIVGIPLLFGAWWLSLIYFPSALRTWVTPFQTFIRPMMIGIMEIVNAVLFILLVIVLYPG